MEQLIRAKAPLRISFAGGGTDVPPFPEREGGCVLSSTINRYAWGTLKPRADGQICINSLDFGVSLAYASREDLDYDGEMDLAKAAIKRLAGGHDVGYDLFLHTDAPPGSGLGSSSAMMVALVGLLKEFHNLTLTDYEVAEVAYSIERVDLGIMGGMQDQYAAAFGGFNFIEFLADRVSSTGSRSAVTSSTSSSTTCSLATRASYVSPRTSSTTRFDATSTARPSRTRRCARSRHWRAR